MWVCASSIDRALLDEPGVMKSEVNFSAEQVSITFDDQQTNPARLQDVIRQSGFQVVEASEGQTSKEAATEAGACRIRKNALRMLLFCAALTAPLFLLSMGRDFGVLGRMGARGLGEFPNVVAGGSRAAHRGMGVLSSRLSIDQKAVCQHGRSGSHQHVHRFPL